MAQYQNFQGRRCNNGCLFFQNQANEEVESCQSTSRVEEIEVEEETCGCQSDCCDYDNNACERNCLKQCRCRYEQRVHCLEHEYKRNLACLQNKYECCLERAKCEYEHCKVCCKCNRQCYCCRKNRGFFF